MREILFRGKRIDNGEWVESHSLLALLYEDGNTHYFLPSKTNGCTVETAVDTFGNIGVIDARQIGIPLIDSTTLSQFTGLTDMNGNKVFGGDIYDDGITKRVVEDSVSGYHFLDHDTKIFDNDKLQYVVIGNIYDNPELLKGEYDD